VYHLTVPTLRRLLGYWVYVHSILLGGRNFCNVNVLEIWDLLNSLKKNGRESAINRAIDGSTYPTQKLVPSPLCKKI
jgi:hypothetical protein